MFIIVDVPFSPILISLPSSLYPPLPLTCRSINYKAMLLLTFAPLIFSRATAPSGGRDTQHGETRDYHGRRDRVNL